MVIIFKNYMFCIISMILTYLVIFEKIFGNAPKTIGVYFGLTYLIFLIIIQYYRYKAVSLIKNRFINFQGMVRYLVNKNGEFGLDIFPGNNNIAYYVGGFALKNIKFGDSMIDYSIKKMRINFLFPIVMFFTIIPLFLYAVN